jgi:AraC-like DNA-binding protein
MGQDCGEPEHARRTLFRGFGLRVDDWRCRARISRWGQEEPNETHSIAFVRRGLFLRESRDGTVVGDPTRVLFFNQGEGYRYAHPLDGGDDCTIVALEDAAARSLVEEAELPVDPGGGPFHAGVASAGTRAAQLQRELSLALEASAPALELQAIVLELLDEALRALGPSHDTPHLTRRQRALVEEARLAILRSLAEPPTLVELAAYLGCSPFHISRLFRATGLGLRQYLRRVRVRLAAERLRRGTTDLTELALELGFCDHSHLTRAFRAEWGVPPSRFTGARARLVPPHHARPAEGPRSTPPA